MQMVVLKPANKGKKEEVLEKEPVKKEEVTEEVVADKVENKTVEKKEMFNSVKDTITNKEREKIEVVDPNALIPCRSLTTGNLIWDSYVWEEYGSVIEVPMKELTRMRGTKPKFLRNLHMIVEDEKAVKELGLNELYEEVKHVDKLADLFDLSLSDLEYALDVLPQSLHKGIRIEAAKAIKSGQLANLNKIRLIEDKLKLDDGLRLYLNL